MYDFIHKLLKKKKYEQVLDVILKDGQIREPFDDDLNHAWYIIGDCYYKLENLKFAVESFIKSLHYWPEDISAMIALSNCYSELNTPELSSEVLEKALMIDPSNETLYYNIGNAYFDQKKYQNAKSFYKKIIQSSNLYEMAQNNLKAIGFKLSEK